MRAVPPSPRPSEATGPRSRPRAAPTGTIRWCSGRDTPPRAATSTSCSRTSPPSSMTTTAT
eukprot:288581-Prymnesium_polylepis.1